MQASESSATPRQLPKIVVSLILLAGFVWMLRRGGIPLLPKRDAFETVTWWAIPAFAIGYAACIWFRTYRWVYLLRPLAEVDAKRTFGINMIGFGAILFAPLRMGEIVRPYMLSQRTPITFTQAMGTIAAERIIDGLAVSSILLVGLVTSRPISPLPDHLGSLPLPIGRIVTATHVTLAIFACAFVAMGLFHWRRAFAEKATSAVVGVVSKRLAAWLTKRVEHVADGLGFLPDPRHSVPFFRDTVLYWIASVGATWVLLYGCGIPASIPETCVIMGVVALGILIPSGPGFFGAFQLAGYTALAMFFPENVVLSAGAAYIFVSYTVQVAMTLAGTVLGFALERAANAETPAAEG